MIRVSGLRKRFGSREILKGISFDVPPQTVLGVIGASGSGKSTLLRCLNGLETINDGTIECDNVRLEAGISHADYRRRVKDLRLKVGTVFQHFHLFPHLSVLGNIIEAPVHVLRTPKKTAETEALELLESVGLGNGLAFRRRTTTRGNSPRTRDASGAVAARRTDQRARSATHQQSAHAVAHVRRSRSHDDHHFPLDGISRRRCRQHSIYGRRVRRRARTCGSGTRIPERSAHEEFLRASRLIDRVSLCNL